METERKQKQAVLLSDVKFSLSYSLCLLGLLGEYMKQLKYLKNNPEYEVPEDLLNVDYTALKQQVQYALLSTTKDHPAALSSVHGTFQNRVPNGATNTMGKQFAKRKESSSNQESLGPSSKKSKSDLLNLLEHCNGLGKGATECEVDLAITMVLDVDYNHDDEHASKVVQRCRNMVWTALERVQEKAKEEADRKSFEDKKGATKVWHKADKKVCCIYLPDNTYPLFEQMTDKQKTDILNIVAPGLSSKADKESALISWVLAEHERCQELSRADVKKTRTDVKESINLHQPLWRKYEIWDAERHPI